MFGHAKWQRGQSGRRQADWLASTCLESLGVLEGQRMRNVVLYFVVFIILVLHKNLFLIYVNSFLVYPVQYGPFLRDA